MIDIKRSHLIAATAAPLGIVLIAAALVLSRGRSPTSADPDAGTPTATEKKGKGRERTGARRPAAPDGARTLAVSADGFDRISTTLDELGAGYRYELIDDETLIDPAALGRFKAVFLTCAGGAAGEPPKDVPKALHEYVSNGGTLYASDLRYDTLAVAFEDLLDRPSVAQGIPQDLRGQVTSPELRNWLGHDITLHFKSEGWRPAAFRGDDVSVLLKGQLKTTAGVAIDAPLAVRFPIGKGTVIFTSFHSEGRVSGDEAKLMRFLVLKTITSASEARLTETLADAGFSTGAVWAAAADAGSPPAYLVYQHKKAGPLRFRLEPARPGARLRLEVVGPRGKTTTKHGDSTLAIDLPQAAPGRWRFRAAVETVPYPSFPAVMVVGTPGDSSDPRSASMNPALVETGGNVRFTEVDLGNNNGIKQERRPLRIAVTEPLFDDMGKLLNALGDGYQHTEIADDDLIKPAGLDRFDVLFLTCGGWPRAWALTLSNTGIRPGLGGGEMRPDILQRIKQNLNKFVGRGGTLYASDLRCEFLYYAFPERIPAPDFDLRRLKAIEDTEKTWFKLVIPAVQVETAAETLDKLQLPEQLRAHRDKLLAILNTSVLVELGKKADDMDDLASVRARMERYELPATEADCQAIAAGFGRRRTAIQDAVRGRSKTKLSKLSGESNRLLARLKEYRDRLIIDFDGAGGQNVDAAVVDSGLQESIGPTIRLGFPDRNWQPGRFAGEGQVLIRGSYISVRRDRIEAPLLVRFRQGKGTVIFTSFHNEAQNSQQELQLLRYLVFSAVTAKEEALTQETMLAGGFSPVKQGQVNHAMGMDSITKTYQSTSGDPLRFSLNFGGGGAILRLTLVAPGGQTFERDADETLLVEASGAPAGKWLYTVTAVKVPYKNFAYSVSIGKGAPAAPPRER